MFKINIAVNSVIPVLSADYERRIVFMEPISDKALLGHVIRRELASDERHGWVKCFIIYIRPSSCNKPVKYNSIFHRVKYKEDRILVGGFIT